MNKLEINMAVCKAIGRQYHRPTEEEVAKGCYYQYEPGYASDLNACGEIFTFLHREERQIEMTMTNESWHVRISDNEGDSFITVVGELGELPLVICQAFLQYKGEWKS